MKNLKLAVIVLLLISSPLPSAPITDLDLCIAWYETGGKIFPEGLPLQIPQAVNRTLAVSLGMAWRAYQRRLTDTFRCASEGDFCLISPDTGALQRANKIRDAFVAMSSGRTPLESVSLLEAMRALEEYCNHILLNPRSRSSMPCSSMPYGKL